MPAYQVTWSDWFASHVDIHDAYSPMDHWQWAATLWRDVVGPDVTVAVQADGIVNVPSASAADKNSAVTGGNVSAGGISNTSAGGGGGGKTTDKASGSGNALVEVRLEEARAVIVRGERDRDGGGIGEGGLRRVGFEIGEWVRGWEEREGDRVAAARRGS